jgi:hypothetical protein
MFLGKITGKRTNVVRGTTVLSVVHPAFYALKAAVFALDFTELDMQFELDNCGVDMTTKINSISVVLKPGHIRINPSNDMFHSGIN